MTMLQANLPFALPLVDISPFLADTLSVHNACKDVGVTYLVGHGISKEEREKARGYQRLMQNITRYKKNCHEGIDLYAPIDNSHTLRKKGPKTMVGENRWPSSPADFRETYEAYIESSRSCGQHTDYGCLTILYTDETPRALQVMSKTGQWIDANPVPDAFVANIRDMFATWTNGLYAATLHQVSVPFFFESNFDAFIQPLTFLNPSSTEFKSVVCGEHLLTSNFGVDNTETELFPRQSVAA
ncbi:hypothetical protein BJ742DRAFT_747388 [Cladochytrium replicatum]|nr:hypothetical protein BJ742DRAFT_747388 [Cladochytrium replicatum]